ncbi:hypothetical protein RA19_24400 [Leisingera sp. ANG-M1]|uniref:LysR substrate-binding domain-containing protein n=1 Tax=Leisingera sp. ANG-M1 TaxID=1577895 RepID=UPI00057C8DE8|nr:LysR substrate-binding domain-containing protein [Leisingera sp. ANG-M1]KIC07347.1 hypothetical protein RA19_24400 [Leisingera sp. ANG-M1]
MNIRQIEIFKAIMDYGSVTEAAERLNVTQPSVSKHLKLLEYDLGLKLFARTGNRLIATREGQALYDQIGRVYTGLGQLRSFAEDLKHNRHGEVTIAAMPLLAQFWLPEKLAPFMTEHEGVSFSLPVRSSRWISQSVAARRADFGLGLTTGEDIPGIETRPLMSLPLVCVMRSDHRLAEFWSVEAADLENEDVVTLKNFDRWRLALEGVLEDRKFKPKRYIDTFSTHVACQLVKNGVGVALVDMLSASYHLDSGLVARAFEPEFSFETSVMTPEHWQQSKLSAHLIAHLQDQARATEKDMQKRLQA